MLSVHLFTQCTYTAMVFHDEALSLLLTFATLSSLIYPLTMRVVGAPQMISQPVSSILPCSPLPSGTWRPPGLSIPCCLPISSSVCLVFFPLSLCLAKWFWPDLMNGRHDHTTAVCVSLRWSGGLCVVRLPETHLCLVKGCRQTHAVRLLFHEICGILSISSP